MNWTTRTGLVLAAALVLLLVWESIVLSTREQGDTISEVLVYWSRRYPLLTLAMGMFMGHLFWPIRSYDVPPSPPALTATKVP